MNPPCLPRIKACRRRPTLLTRSSPNQIPPESAPSNNPRRFRSVLLPDPDGPVTARYSPALTSRSRPLSTTTGAPTPVENVLVSPMALIIAAALTSAPAVDPPAEGESQSDPRAAARQAHDEALPQNLGQELKVRGPQRTLDPEVSDPLEQGSRHRVGQRERTDQKPQRADPDDERGEERRGIPEEPAHLAGDGDVDAGHPLGDPPGHRVRVLAIDPAHRRPCVQILEGQARTGAEHLTQQRILCEPEVPRGFDADDGEAIRSRERPLQDPDDDKVPAVQCEARPGPETPRGGEVGPHDHLPPIPAPEKPAGPDGKLTVIAGGDRHAQSQ